MKKWQNLLVRCLQLGITDQELRMHLDELLAWYGNRSQKESEELTAALLAQYDEQDLKQRFEELLDRLFIVDGKSKSLFPAQLGAEQAKKRYRQLIRVFHPDRGSKDEVWLNYRAELINRAYDNYRSPSNSTATASASGKRPSANKAQNYSSARPFKETGKKAAKGKPLSMPSIKFRPSVWRKRLGDPKKLQRNIIIVIALVSFILVLSFYASTQEPSVRRSVNEPLESTPILVDSAKGGADIVSSTDSNDGSFEDEASRDEVSTHSDLNATTKQNDRVDSEFSPDLDHQVVAKSPALAGAMSADNKPNTTTTVVDVRLSEKASRINEDEKLSQTANQKGSESTLAQFTNESEFKEAKPKTDITSASTTARDSSTEPSLTLQGNPGSDVCSETISISSASSELDIVRITTQVLSVRVGPSMQCPESYIAKSGFKFSILRCETQSEWCLIRLDQIVGEEVVGWVNRVYLSSVNPPGPEIDALLNNYKTYFEAGNLRKLSSLYTLGAQENNMRGIDEISSSYAKYFKNTTDRSLRFEVAKLSQEDTFSAVLEGIVVSERKDDGDRRLFLSRSTFKLIIVRTVSSYKIVAYDHQFIDEIISGFKH